MNVRLCRWAVGLALFSFTTLVPHHASADPFDLYLVPTVDNQLDSWFRVPSTLAPTIYSPDRVYPYQPVSLRLLFRNYGLSPAGNAKITYAIRVFGPDGQPTPDSGDDLLGYDGPVKTGDAIIINQQILSVFFDETYPFGEYDIRAVATDHVAGHTISRSAKISYAPFAKVANFASFDYFSFWVRNYFSEPDVAKAVFGFLQFFEESPAWAGRNTALLAFTHRLLQDNPWVRPRLAELYRDADVPRNGVIALFALLGELPADLAASLSKPQQVVFDRFHESSLPRTDTDVTDAGQIDALWGQFYATGHLSPLEKVVRSLKPFALSSPPRATDRKDPPQAAFWTLVEQGIETPLVTHYCRTLLEHGRLSPETIIQLRLALDVIDKGLSESGQDTETKK